MAVSPCLGPGAHPCAFVGKIGKKGLTHTIKTDDTLEALITEVFDNPVARIHSKDRPSRPEQSLVNSIIKCMEAGKEPADILKEIHKLVK